MLGKLTFISVFALSTCAQAFKTFDDQCLENGVAFTLNLGPAWTSAGKTQTLTLQPDIQKSYVADNSSVGLLAGEAFLGYQFFLVPSVYAQFGFTYAFTSQFNLTGSVWEDADPDFDNFKYQYTAFLNNFAVKGKILLQASPTVYPYFGGSIGLRGYNHATNFKETPYIVEEVPAPAFADGSESNVYTYSAEVGIQKVLTKNIYIGIGYSYYNWGNISLGTAPGQTTNSKITVDNVYTNGVRLNVTFVNGDLF